MTAQEVEYKAIAVVEVWAQSKMAPASVQYTVALGLYSLAMAKEHVGLTQKKLEVGPHRLLHPFFALPEQRKRIPKRGDPGLLHLQQHLQQSLQSVPMTWNRNPLLLWTRRRKILLLTMRPSCQDLE